MLLHSHWRKRNRKKNHKYVFYFISKQLCISHRESKVHSLTFETKSEELLMSFLKTNFLVMLLLFFHFHSSSTIPFAWPIYSYMFYYSILFLLTIFWKLWFCCMLFCCCFSNSILYFQIVKECSKICAVYYAYCVSGNMLRWETCKVNEHFTSLQFFVPMRRAMEQKLLK